MADIRISDVDALPSAKGNYKIPVGIGDTNAHTILISALLAYIKQNINLQYGDIAGAPNVPTLVSQLVNDKGYTTMQEIDAQNFAFTSDIPTMVSQLTNDAKYTTLQEVKSAGYLMYVDKVGFDPERNPQLKVENNYLYDVNSVPFKGIEILNCDVIVPAYLEFYVKDVVPTIKYPTNSYVCGVVNETNKFYRMTFFNNTIKIDKFNKVL